MEADRVYQMVLGVPAYGKSYYVAASDAYTDSAQTMLKPYTTFDKAKQPLGEGEKEGASKYF